MKFSQNTRIEAQRYHELREKDTLKFGNSRLVYFGILVLSFTITRCKLYLLCTTENSCLPCLKTSSSDVVLVCVVLQGIDSVTLVNSDPFGLILQPRICATT